MTDYYEEMRRRGFGEMPNHLRMAPFLNAFSLFEETLTGEWPKLPHPACKQAVKNLQDVVIDCDGKECSICLMDYKKKEVVKKMPCQHMFHALCLITWLNQNNTCPFCRQKLPPAEPEEIRKDH